MGFFEFAQDFWRILYKVVNFFEFNCQILTDQITRSLKQRIQLANLDKLRNSENFRLTLKNFCRFFVWFSALYKIWKFCINTRWRKFATDSRKEFSGLAIRLTWLSNELLNFLWFQIDFSVLLYFSLKCHS